MTNNGAVETLGNPFTTDDIQPPSCLLIFVHREFPRKHKVFLGGRKVICKILPGSIWFGGCFLDIEGEEEIIDSDTFPLYLVQNSSGHKELERVSGESHRMNLQSR